MIDWYLVAASASWILGSAIVLAAFSHQMWLARVTAQPLRQFLAQPSWRLAFAGGLFLVCLGLGLGERVWWRKAIWGALAASFAWDFVRAARNHMRTHR